MTENIGGGLAFELVGGGKVTVDLAQLPSGRWYEDRYRGYLDVFNRIAATPSSMHVTVLNAPWSWVPLLLHLNCEVAGMREHFEHCPVVRAAIARALRDTGMDRTTLDVLVGFRPECADVLWKIDMQWKCAPGRVRDYSEGQEFVVTTNGSFHRREVLDYIDRLKEYKPRKNKALLVPCAADKPYPAPMHRACMNLMPSEFYMINATGVVGLVPQDYWSIMPHYDSGIPNQWRLYEMVKWYFSLHQHERIVVYCDFYSETIWEAFKAIGYRFQERSHSQFELVTPTSSVEFVLPVQRYDDYVDLMTSDNLSALAGALVR